MSRSRIAVKGDVDRMPGLKAAGFDVFELYVRDETRLDTLPPAEATICAVHQPGTVAFEGRRVRANLCDPGPAGERATAVLDAVVAYAVRCGAPKVVVHPGYFDGRAERREDALDRLARRLTAVRNPTVTICVENITRWSNALFDREPAIARETDFLQWRDRAPVGTGLVFDVEHFLLSELMSVVADDFADRFGPRSDAADAALVDAVDAAFRARTAREWRTLEPAITARMEAIVALIAPGLAHMHVCGSDLASFGERDRREGVGVYKGEHLPVGYAGRSADIFVEDRIPHERWIAALGGHRPADVVLEISERPEFDALKELERSRQVLERAL